MYYHIQNIKQNYSKVCTNLLIATMTKAKQKDVLSKSNVSQLSKVINQLDQFTNNLEAKVDGMLKAQQLQFIQSYKVHMRNVKKEFDNLALELKKKDEIIASYENQGKMANLIKRVAFLQQQEKKLLTNLQKKKSQIRELMLQRAIKKSQIKRLQQKVKQLIKSRVSNEQRYQRDRNASYESIPTFTTQIGYQNSNKALSKMMTQQRSLKMESIYRRSEKSQASINPEHIVDSHRLQRQNSKLKKQNRQLISFNSKFISATTTMEKFFIQTVNEIKKNIAVRKKVKQCTLQQFRKEDKLELLIKILSNDDILFQLYSLIFNKRENPFKDEKVATLKQNQRPLSLRGKINRSNLQKSVEYQFPSISSARLY